jgi:FlaA1/EpsC-like NDP-sugar epimerase
VPVVGDVKHAALVDEVLTRERPSVIFHAAPTSTCP